MTVAIPRYQPALSCSGIAVSFGAFRALTDVTISVGANEVVALIGPNGAGKTTLLNVISGRQAPSAGTVSLAGTDITRQPSYCLAHLGLGRSFQLISIFPDMSVLENLRLGVQRRLFNVAPPWRPVSSYRHLRAATDELLERFGLAPLRDRPAGQLSHGQQRALELGLAVAGNPRTLLLDEPLAGVGASELPKFIELVSSLCRERSVLLIEHNMDAVMKIADRIVVLVRGNVIAAGTPSEIQNRDDVRVAYLGVEVRS